MLAAEGLVKTYGRLRALDEFTLNVAAGWPGPPGRWAGAGRVGILVRHNLALSFREPGPLLSRLVQGPTLRAAAVLLAVAAVTGTLAAWRISRGWPRSRLL